MDLIKAIQALGTVKDSLTHENLIEVKQAICKMDNAMAEVAYICDAVDLPESENFLQLIATWEDLKNEIVGRFE